MPSSYLIVSRYRKDVSVAKGLNISAQTSRNIIWICYPVFSVRGNCNPRQGAFNAARLLEANNLNIPVYIGGFLFCIVNNKRPLIINHPSLSKLYPRALF